MNMTQLFVGLGDQPFAMVLGKPTHGSGSRLPDLGNVKCFVFPPGHGIMIHKGTWHDFPLCVKDPVTVLTANSPEVVEALASMGSPREMDHGDVYKIEIRKRTGRILKAFV
jgi:ureidoglycolate lyase